MSNIIVVIAKYKESVNWIESLKVPYIIFNKDPEANHLFEHNRVNFGRETETFLSYIIDNYNNINNYTVFLQGNPFDHDPSVVDRINNFEFDKEIIPLGAVYNRDGSPLPDTINWAKKCSITFEEPIRFISGMQCIVSRNLILQRSLESYKHIYSHVSKQIDYNCYTGYFFEYLWPTILNFNKLV